MSFIPKELINIMSQSNKIYHISYEQTYAIHCTAIKKKFQMKN